MEQQYARKERHSLPNTAGCCLPLRVVGEDPLGRVAPRHLVPPLDGARRAPLAARRRRPRRRHGRRAHVVVVPRDPPGDGHGRRRHCHHALHAPAAQVGVSLSHVLLRFTNMKIEDVFGSSTQSYSAWTNKETSKLWLPEIQVRILPDGVVVVSDGAAGDGGRAGHGGGGGHVGSELREVRRGDGFHAERLDRAHLDEQLIE